MIGLNMSRLILNGTGVSLEWDNAGGMGLLLFLNVD